MFLIIVGIVAVMVVSSIINGFVLSTLWSWFVVPTFGLPELSIAAAIGISLIIRTLTYQDKSNETKKEDETFSEKIIPAIGVAIFAPLLTLFFGWVIHLFM